MDRFNGNEDIEFHAEGLSQGRLARLDGEPMSANPYSPVFDRWLHKSWNAGWADADMDSAAPKSEDKIPAHMMRWEEEMP